LFICIGLVFYFFYSGFLELGGFEFEENYVNRFCENKLCFRNYFGFDGKVCFLGRRRVGGNVEISYKFFSDNLFFVSAFRFFCFEIPLFFYRKKPILFGFIDSLFFDFCDFANSRKI
jgi:hypothetical protein